MPNDIITDTSDFSKIDYKDILLVGNKKYLIKGNAKEERFGIEDPKFWVKKAVEVKTRERKIIKLVFFEEFNTTLGGIVIRCFRDPDKESRVLEIAKGHPNFMQGISHIDTNGNNVRIIDVVGGQNLYNYIGFLSMKHEIYFRDILPTILEQLANAFSAIGFLHQNGLRHGDIRSDHIYMERATGNFVWIDFDYDFEATENTYSLDLFGIGNVLLFAIGKGIHQYSAIKSDQMTYGDLVDRISYEDFALLEPSRLLNLKKIYPYIPDALNNMLMHFSAEADIYYETVADIVEDLEVCISLIQ